MSDCAICGRRSEKDDLCAYHISALENVKIAFDEWRKALEIDWNTYLTRLLDEENIGKWAREVVEYLMQQDGS